LPVELDSGELLTGMVAHGEPGVVVWGA
jgi:hypothetical protein